MSWTLYILECIDQTLYTGITNDLARRLSQHECGEGARYTKGRGPFRVVYTENLPDRPAALRRELAIKKLSRAEKMKIIA